MSQKRIEKDFEKFLHGIVKLEPVEFCGLAKLMGIKMAEKVEDKFQARPLDIVMEEMMDRFLGLPKKRQREILMILKDARRGD